ncbi:MAG: hypothetical protein WDZ28_03125 [Simkaniaceae bacterium]
MSLGANLTLTDEQFNQLININNNYNSFNTTVFKIVAALTLILSALGKVLFTIGTIFLLSISTPLYVPIILILLGLLLSAVPMLITLIIMVFASDNNLTPVNFDKMNTILCKSLGASNSLI